MVSSNRKASEQRNVHIGIGVPLDWDVDQSCHHLVQNAAKIWDIVHSKLIRIEMNLLPALEVYEASSDGAVPASVLY